MMMSTTQRNQFDRNLNKDSLNRCAKTSYQLEHILFTHNTPFWSFVSISFSYSHTMRNFPTPETRESS